MDFNQLRKTEYARLDLLHETYLDYTGSGLYSQWQIEKHHELLLKSVMGNPHSHSPSSIASTEKIESARAKVLSFFNGSPDDYDVVFTQNATQALKLIGENFPFNEESTYVLTSDNHNSVNGIREYALGKGAKISYIPLSEHNDVGLLSSYLPEMEAGNHGLFAYPAQSNFSGTRYPLEWIEFAQSRGYRVILDAAAFVPTNVLNLQKITPDFIPISFYKMFGYPTGVGALIARHDAMELLRREWFSGGTVDLVTTKAISHHLLDSPRGFEDGTPNFLDISAVQTGLEFLETVGMKNIHENVMKLSGYLVKELKRLMHGNGKPVVNIYGANAPESHGSAIALNVLTPSGKIVDPRIIGKIATENSISLRTGCFCNPGSGEHFFGYSVGKEADCIQQFRQGQLELEDFPKCAGGLVGGAVRVSLGIATIKKDIDALIGVLTGLIDCPESINEQKVETSFSC